MEKRVFSKEEFVKAASKDFVLLELDYPNKGEQSDALKKQNADLQSSFGIQAFPTLLVCDAEGRPYAEAGFPDPMSPEGMVKMLEATKDAKKTRDSAFAMADKAKGVERAKLLVKALKTVPAQYMPGAYGETIDEIAKLNPEDETGFVKAAKTQRALAELEGGFGAFMQEEKFDDAIKYIDTFVKEHKPEGATLQKALLYKFFGLAAKEDFDAAIKLADEIVKIDKDSETATIVTQMKKQLKDR